jgi:hypothetical protein
MLLKLIACNIFTREVCHCLPQSPHTIDVEFTELGEHGQPDRLRASLQNLIDRADASPKQYDAVLLLYGLCGNAAAGLTAGQVPLILPRAHDCCTILLGSRQAFREHFEANPSMPFSSVGYMERGEYYLRTADGDTELSYENPYDAYVREYGEENARFIWESMHPEHLRTATSRAVFIGHEETGGLGHAERFQAAAEAEGKEYIFLPGDLGMIRRLLAGAWDGDEFLTVPAGHSIAGVYDWDEIVRAVPRTR